jgi:intracellular multiplication protein IcmO
MFIIAGQDVEAMERGENKEEVQSVLANTKTKIALAQEAGSASKTFEVFEKSAGEQFVSQCWRRSKIDLFCGVMPTEN